MAGVIVISSLLFDKFLSIDKEVTNSIYYRRYSVERSYVDSQFEIAKSYGIEYSAEVCKAIKKRNHSTIQYLLDKTKQSFNKQEKVGLEFLFLEKILLHNLHTNQRYYPVRTYGDKNWCFAFPEQIYNQIMLYDSPDCIEVELLFDILSEQISLFEIPDFDDFNFEGMSDYERDHFFYGKNLHRATETILSRLIQVRDKLYMNEKYSKYKKLLPELKFTENRTQKWVELEL